LCLGVFVVLEILFAVLGFLYSAVTPIYEAPDEVWHDAYVRWVAGGNGLPPLDEDRSGAYQEAAQPPLYYLVAAAVRRLFPDDDLPTLMWHNPFFGYQAGGTVNDNKNMLIHTDRERFPWTGAARAVHATRLVSLFFGLVTVAATGMLAWEAVGNRGGGAIPLSAAALVALTPQFLFISGIVSNDSAAAAMATLSLWAAARLLRRGADLRGSLLLGLLVGLAALTKTSALLLVPLALAAVFLSPGGTARQKVARALVVLGTAVVVGGWWYGRNALLYGDPLGISRHVQTPWGRQTPASLATLLSEMPRLYRSFWGAFGWGHVEYPAWIYAALGGLVVVLALVGWGRRFMRRWETLFSRRLWCQASPPGTKPFADAATADFPVVMELTVGEGRPSAEGPGRATSVGTLQARGDILLLAATWCGAVFLALLQWMRQVEAPHGRLLFPAIGAWALLTAVGWEHLPWPREARSGVLLALVLLNLLTPVLVIYPAFARPRLRDPAAVSRTVAGPRWTYGGAAQLLGAAPDRPSVAPGEVLTVRACWTARAPMEKDYTVVVQLVGRENIRIGERHTYPGLGRFPTSLWPVGRAFCDDYRVRVAPWAPAPELYDGRIGLYDKDPSALLPVVGEDGQAVEAPVAFRVRVAPQRPLAVTPHPSAGLPAGGGHPTGGVRPDGWGGGGGGAHRHPVLARRRGPGGGLPGLRPPAGRPGGNGDPARRPAPLGPLPHLGLAAGRRRPRRARPERPGRCRRRPLLPGGGDVPAGHAGAAAGHRPRRPPAGGPDSAGGPLMRGARICRTTVSSCPAIVR
jgi:4-amino-4-deoxy-L-arabinose transferase-like glycosyltransferase